MLDLDDVARARGARRTLGRGAARRRDVPRSHARDAAADGGDALAARDQRVVDVEGVRACPACASAGRCAATPQLAETLLAAKEQMFICGATLDEAIAGRVLADRDRILPPILDDVRARLEIVRAWIGGQTRFEWIEPAGGVVGLVRFAPGVSRRHRSLLRRVARGVRHVRRARSLVRGRRPPLPPRLRLADGSGAARRPRRALDGRGCGRVVETRRRANACCFGVAASRRSPDCCGSVVVPSTRGSARRTPPRTRRSTTRGRGC